MSNLDLTRLALAVNQSNLALGHETFTADGATFVRNERYPRVYDANHVADITAATRAEIDRLLARVEAEFASLRHRAFHTDFQTPPAFEALLQLYGYSSSTALVLLLEGELIGDVTSCDIRPVKDDAAWDALFGLHELDWQEHAARTGSGGDATVGRDLARAQRAKSPPVRNWLAYVDGVARGYFNSWEGTDGVGQVENLFVQAEYRHRGLASALIHHCVADARAHGAGAVAIVADAEDTPKHMYATMGFRPVAVKRSYLKTIS